MARDRHLSIECAWGSLRQSHASYGSHMHCGSLSISHKDSAYYDNQPARSLMCRDLGGMRNACHLHCLHFPAFTCKGHGVERTNDYSMH